MVSFFSLTPENRNTFLRSLLAFAVRALGLVIGFGFNLSITKHLSPKEAGYFFLCFSIALLLSAVARLGFENTILRYTGSNPKKGYTIKHILNFAIIRSAFLAILLGVLIFNFSSIIAVYVFNKPELKHSLESVSPAICGFSIIFLLAMSLQGRQKVFLSICSNSILHLLICIILIIFFGINDASQALNFLSFSLLLSVFICYLIATSNLNKNGLPIDKKKIFESAKPNWVTSVMNQSMQWVPTIIVGIFMAANEVAFFSVALKISLLSSFFLMAINFVVAPKFSYYSKNNDITEIRKTAIFSVRLLIFSASPFLLFVFIMPDFFMGLFGDEYISSSYILQILTAGQLINILCGPVGFILLMTGNEKDMRLITLISGVGMLVLISLVVIFFGTTGAAICVSFFLALQNLLGVWLVKQRLGFNILRFWQRI